MSIIKHFGTGLFSLGNLTALVANLTKRVKDLENAPSGGDGNGIYSGSDNIPVATLASVTEDVGGNVMDFAIGVFPTWPNISLSGGERGFYHGKNYWGGIGLVYEEGNIQLNQQQTIIQNKSLDETKSVQITNSGTNGNIDFTINVPGRFGGMTVNTFSNHNGVSLYGTGSSFTIRHGNVTPNSNITGSPGDIYIHPGGGAGNIFWVKESGSNTNTGWVAK